MPVIKSGTFTAGMHRGPRASSVSLEAARYGREHGVHVIDEGCARADGRPRPTS